MSLPIFLPYGVVSIYGVGSISGINNIVQPIGYLWGNIDQVSQYGITWATAGTSVLFPDSEVICRLAYQTDNTSYTLIQETNLICREDVAP